MPHKWLNCDLKVYATQPGLLLMFICFQVCHLKNNGTFPQSHLHSGCYASGWLLSSLEEGIISIQRK